MCVCVCVCVCLVTSWQQGGEVYSEVIMLAASPSVGFSEALRLCCLHAIAPSLHVKLKRSSEIWSKPLHDYVQH